MTIGYGGTYSEAAAVRFVLEKSGVRAAHSGEPLSEAMVFGISGGIGFAHFTFSYEGQIPTLYIGTAHRYKTKFGEMMTPFFERTGLQQTVKTSSSANAADKHLLEALQTGRPVVVHTDHGMMPYDLSGRCYLDHALVVTEYKEAEDAFVVADLARVPLLIKREDLRKARESINSLKHRSSMIMAPEAPLDLQAAVRAGIAACVEGLRNPPNPAGNFGLGGMRKWATLIHDVKNKKGWPTLFPPGAPLAQALQGLFLCVEVLQSGRGALRGLYADYLREAAVVLAVPRLTEVAARYDRLAALWTDVAERALADEVPLLGAVKRLERQKQEVFRNQGLDALDELQGLEAELQAVKSQLAAEFPLDEAATRQLLDQLHMAIEEIVQQEEAAIAELAQI